MKRTFYLIFLAFLLNNCSFDNKTGIWTGSKNISKKKDVKDSNIELIFKKQNEIIKDKELPLKQNLKLERLNQQIRVKQIQGLLIFHIYYKKS